MSEYTNGQQTQSVMDRGSMVFTCGSMHSFLNLLSDILMSAGLAMDCFAVSIAISLSRDGSNPVLRRRLPVMFGIFQGSMALLGWGLGALFLKQIKAWDHWIALFLLGGVGIHMILESFGDHEQESRKKYSGWKILILLSVATSIDALAVGLGLASLGQPMFGRALLIGVASFLFAFAGLVWGKRIGVLIGNRAEMIGGIILIFLGIKIFIEHRGWKIFLVN